MKDVLWEKQDERTMSWILKGNALYRIEIFKSLSGKKLKKPFVKSVSAFKRQIGIETKLLGINNKTNK